MWKIIQFSKFVDLFVFYFIIQIGVIQAQSNRLFINEYMASNNQTITDEGANYDDWVEIYKNGEVRRTHGNWMALMVNC